MSRHASSPSETRDPRSGVTEAPTVLLVDDDPDFLDVNRHVLEAAGYRVVCAPDPAAAFDAMAREKPSLVVTDVMMKALDSGFSLARAVKADERLRDVPVIVVTAIASRLVYDFAPRKVGDLGAMGADAFLEKPVAPGALLAEIAGLLRRRVEEETP